MARDECVNVSPRTMDGCAVSFTKLRRRFDKRVEHDLQIEGRAADDLQYVCSRGLLLQRFAQLVEQPRVLDRDDGLGGEARDQRDLFISKGTNLLAVHDDCADQFTLLQHGDGYKRPYTAEFDGGDDVRIAFFNVELLCSQIGDMNRRFACKQATDRIFRISGRASGCKASENAGGVLTSQPDEELAIPAIDLAEFGLADARGILQHGSKHRLQDRRASWR